MVRLFVFMHRWVGLAMTLFLVIVGLTGSALAFREELDVWLNPELLTVAKRDAPLLDAIYAARESRVAFIPMRVSTPFNCASSRTARWSSCTCLAWTPVRTI